LWSFVPLLLVWLVAMIIVLVFAGTLVLLAAFLLFLARRARRKIGIPSGEIFYQDLVGQPFQAKVLRSPRWGISGKPDCLIRTPDGIVPVELKKSKRPPARGGVYPNHMIQILRIAPSSRTRCKPRCHGLVIYAGQQLRRVEYNEANRLWLNRIIAEVRMARTLPRVTRNHQSRGRCSGCGLWQQCDQSLMKSP
jgi:CRISPR-associated exonuclease Cas4